MEPAFPPLMIVLQGLAGSGQMRHSSFPETQSVPHDLILGFERARMTAESIGGADWTPEQRRVIASIDTALRLATSASNAAVWSRQELTVDPFWTRICELSRVALQAFGWPVETATVARAPACY